LYPLECETIRKVFSHHTQYSVVLHFDRRLWFHSEEGACLAEEEALGSGADGAEEAGSGNP
jgi:hypothetical protein